MIRRLPVASDSGPSRRIVHSLVFPTHAWLALATALVLSLHPRAALPAPAEQDIQVEVHKNGAEITVRVGMCSPFER